MNGIESEFESCLLPCELLYFVLVFFFFFSFFFLFGKGIDSIGIEEVHYYNVPCPDMPEVTAQTVPGRRARWGVVAS